MARTKRRVVGSSCFQQLKKSRTSDHISDYDAMDLNHSNVGENIMEELEKSEADGTDDDDNNSNKEGKEEIKDDDDEEDDDD
eukprot:12124835-Ditylum_brightwellii.AAC.1